MKKLFIVGVLLATPMVAGAISTVGDFTRRIIDVINNALVPLILAFAFIVFIWGVFRFFIADTEEAKTRGRELLVYGLIGFFVIISVWGIVNLLINTFDLDSRAPTELPKVLRDSGSGGAPQPFFIDGGSEGQSSEPLPGDAIDI